MRERESERAYEKDKKGRSGVCKSVELISKVFSKLYVVVSLFFSLSVQKLLGSLIDVENFKADTISEHGL